MSPQEQGTYLTHYFFDEAVASGRVQELPNGLLDLAVLFGSVHSSANWREDPDFFEELGIYREKIFSPRVPPKDWDETNAKREAWAMHRAGVIVFRLENRTARDVSLGSMAEIGMAVVSSIVRGQRLIVSIEDGFETTFTDIGSRAQCAALLSFLEEIIESANHNGNIVIHRGNNLSSLAHLITEAFETTDKSQQFIENDNIFQYVKQARSRVHKPKPRFVITGSSGPYAPDVAERFVSRKKEAIMGFQKPSIFECIDLADGAIAAGWTNAWSTPDADRQYTQLQRMFEAELGFKKRADVLIIPILQEAASKAAVAEIGFLLANAFQTGQPIFVLIEPFDMCPYLISKISTLLSGAAATGTLDLSDDNIRSILHIFPEIFLRESTSDQLTKTRQVLNMIRGGQKQVIDMDLINASLIRFSPIYWNADAIWRIRTLVDAHLSELLLPFVNYQNFNSILLYTRNFRTYKRRLQKFAARTNKLHKNKL